MEKKWIVTEKPPTAENLYLKEIQLVRSDPAFPSILGEIDRRVNDLIAKGVTKFSSQKLGSNPANWDPHSPFYLIYQIAPEKADKIFGSIVLEYMKKRSKRFNERWETWNEGNLCMYKLLT